MCFHLCSYLNPCFSSLIPNSSHLNHLESPLSMAIWHLKSLKKNNLKLSLRMLKRSEKRSNAIGFNTFSTFNTWASKASAIFARCCAAATSVAGFRQWGHSGLVVVERISLRQSDEELRQSLRIGTENWSGHCNWCSPTQTTWLGSKSISFNPCITYGKD